MPTYAGISLPQSTPELALWVERNIPLRDAIDHLPTPYLRKLITVLPYKQKRTIDIGRLWWPQGASRWTVGHYLVTEGQLTAIRKVCYPFTSPQAFQLDDGGLGGGVTTNLWMLPPRPLSQNPFTVTDLQKWLLPRTQIWTSDAPTSPVAQDEPLWMLTLADDRYYWWQQHSTVSITVGATTWAQLIAAIGTSLGVTITTDPIPSAYLLPTASLVPYVHYLPLLLDLAAFSVGMRMVRSLSGAVSLQAPLTAIASANTQLAAQPVRSGGGIFALDAA